MTRSRRRFAVWFGILGIAFAQVAVTAHACLTGASVNASAARAVAMAHEGHCTGVPGTAQPAPLAPIANACEVQCTDGAPSATAPDLPPVALAVLPVAPTPVTMTLAERAWDSTWLAATGAQPPPLLQFGHFLI
jgi:hypothetical protein